MKTPASIDPALGLECKSLAAQGQAGSAANTSHFSLAE